MPRDQHLNSYTAVGVVVMLVLAVGFFALGRVASALDTTSAGPAPQVRE